MLNKPATPTPASTSAADKIHVYLRIRPLQPNETGHTTTRITWDKKQPKTVWCTRVDPQSKSYEFHRVFAPDSTQEEFYSAFAADSVNAAMDGYHGVLFAYGQTGSGKTYTISNEDKDDSAKLGVLQRAVREVWQRIHADTQNDYQVNVTYVQLYNEILSDLLAESVSSADDVADIPECRVRLQCSPESKDSVVMISDVTGQPIERSVRSYEDTMEAFKLGCRRKKMGSTKMNNTSSRSHTIFTLYIHKSPKTTIVGCEEAAVPAKRALEGRLILCDLAGSERISKTQAEGAALDEATHINGSLLVLGKVVHALTDKKKSQYVPFRESKLTRLLQYSLSGLGKTSIVVNISPSDSNTEESISAIHFGQRALQIKQNAEKHEVIDYKALYLQLQAQLDNQQDNLVQNAIVEERRCREDEIKSLKDQIMFLESQNSLLRTENEALKKSKGITAVFAPPPASPAGTSPAVPPAGAGIAVAAPQEGLKDWYTALEKMRKIIEQRDAALRKASEEKLQLGLLLSHEKRRVFVVAQRYRATLLRVNEEQKAAAQQIEKLSAEVSESKATDYVAPVMPEAIAEEDIAASTPTEEREAPGGQPRGDYPAPAASPSSVDREREEQLVNELQELRTRLSELRAERRDFTIYQAKAQKAIKLLYAEKEQLTAAVAHLAKGTKGSGAS